MEKNFYKILELDENQWKGKDGKDWEDALKKNFRNLSRKWHPDRFGNKSDAEKKEAEEKMKDINEAYETLKDPKKKQQYDNPSMGGFEGFGGFEDFMANMAGDFFGGGGQRGGRRVEKGSDKNIKIGISIADLINGVDKKIKYKRNVRCSDCNGIGGKGKTVCPYCHGTGVITEQRQMGPNQFFRSQRPCNHCGGQGFKFEHLCDKCHGTGFEEKEEIIDIHFDAGVMQGNPFTAVGKGHQSKDPNGIDGDFNAIPFYDFDVRKFDLNQFPHIIQRVKINWIDALLGGKMNINIEGHGKQMVDIPECTKPNDHIVLHGKGVPYYPDEMSFYHGKKSYGDYILQIEYVAPNALTNEQKDLLKKFKETMK